MNIINTDTPNEYGYYHQSELPDLNHCRDMLSGCVDSLYQDDYLEKLEDFLEELCGEFGIELDARDHMIFRKVEGV